MQGAAGCNNTRQGVCVFEDEFYTVTTRFIIEKKPNLVSKKV